MNGLLLIFGVFVASLSTHAADVPPGERELVECPLAQKRYAFLADDTIECTDDYLRFQSAKRGSSPSQLRIGSFNIIRTGTKQSRFKRFDMVAKIMNQWDLVAAIELMPTPADFLANNRKVDKVREAFEKNLKNYSKKDQQEYAGAIEQSYEKAGYLRILEALRELDPSWSMIMAPKATGDSPSSLEMAGFYYRNGTVESTTSELCRGLSGCLLPISQGLMPLISRIPFSANFKAGSLEFNAVAFHLRFRVAAPDCDTAEGKAAAKAKNKPQADDDEESGPAGCSKLNATAKNWVKKFAGVSNATYRDRFIEFAIINDTLKKSTDEVLIMGDFNLPYKKSNEEAWALAINDKSKSVFVHEATSVSNKVGRSEEYDHFVFNPKGKKLSGCNTAKAAAFDFLLDPEAPKTSSPALKEWEAFLKARNSRPDALLKEYEESITGYPLVTSCDETECVAEDKLDAATIKKNVAEYNKRVVKTPKTDPYKVHVEIISDHLPIHMNCKI